MLTNDLLCDAFERISGVVHNTLDGLNESDLVFRPSNEANSIAWLVWHLTRVQDNHFSEFRGTNQVWDKYYELFEKPYSKSATGYGQSPQAVASFRANTDLLIKYFDEVNTETTKYISTLKDTDYKKIVDKRWDPPVTLAARIVSVLSDDLQHAGQAAYIKGLIKN